MATVVAHLRSRGHEVQVVVDGDADSSAFDSDVSVRPGLRESLSMYQWSDVVLTQLESRNRAMRLATAADRPIVHFLRRGGVDPDRALGIPDLVVFNADWLRMQSPWPGPTEVVHPPIQAERYRTTPGECITLVNVNVAKGADMFFNLARLFPRLAFLGVRSTWGERHMPEQVPANLTMVDPVKDMRLVYGRTRILLMPSAWESYGRVGLEAAASGIPTIASNVPGIHEALRDSARYADRGSVDEWAAHLVSLSDPVEYELQSNRARQRSEEASVESVRELVTLEDCLVKIAASRVSSVPEQ